MKNRKLTAEEALEILKPLFEHCKGTDSCMGYIEHYFTKDEEMALDLAIEALKMRVSQELQMQLPNGVIYAPKLFNGCAVCDNCEVCPDAFCSHSVYCNAYGVPNFHKENNE